MFTPGLELGLRHDGGDAETGTGVELGGRLTYTDPDTGLSVERASARSSRTKTRITASGGRRARCASPPASGGRGLSFSLAPTYGHGGERRGPAVVGARRAGAGAHRR